jgi:hypothetical protein
MRQKLKLARFPSRSPLPVAALPSMSMIPSPPLTASSIIVRRFGPNLSNNYFAPVAEKLGLTRIMRSCYAPCTE